MKWIWRMNMVNENLNVMVMVILMVRVLGQMCLDEMKTMVASRSYGSTTYRKS